MGGNVKGAGPVGGGFENHEATALKVGDSGGHLQQSADMANPANKVPVDATGHQSAQATLDKMFGTPGIEGTGIAQKNPEAMAAAAPDVTPSTPKVTEGLDPNAAYAARGHTNTNGEGDSRVVQEGTEGSSVGKTTA